jgi:hypothetical protein
MDSLLNSITFKEELIPTLLKLIDEIEMEAKLPNTKTRQRHLQKENYRPIPLMNMDEKILNKIMANQI